MILRKVGELSIWGRRLFKDDFIDVNAIKTHERLMIFCFISASRFGQRFIVEATLTILKKNDNEKLNKLLFSDLIIVKFARDYTDGENSNTDWIISHYDHKFVDPKLVTENVFY